MIRAATIDDLPTLTRLGETFYASTTVLGRFEPARFIETWRNLLSLGMGVIYIAERDGVPIGAIGGVKHLDVNSSDIIASEFFWFVDPLERGAGLRLYDAFEKWAKANGCSHIHMVHLADSMPGKLERFYGRKGYRIMEVRYTKEL